MVGQQFIMQLANHPWFRIAWLGASERSEGKEVSGPGLAPVGAASAEVDDMVVEAAGNGPAGRAPRLMFSGLDSKVAGDIEREFASAGHFVVSNARNYRMEQFVPLLVPEVNPDHLAADSASAAIERMEGRHRHESELRDRAARDGARGRSSLRACACHRLDDAGGVGRGISRCAVARHSRQPDSVHRRRRRKNPDRVAEDYGHAADRSRRAASDDRERADDARAGHQRPHRNHQRAVQQEAVARRVEGGVPLVYRQAAAARTARRRRSSRCR